MTTGEPRTTSVKTESFSFDVGASTTCQSMPAYPSTIGYATGAFVSSRVVICGGYPPTPKCYTLAQHDTQWKLNGNLITPRWGAASVEINNKLVVFGGFNSGAYLDSTEEFDVVTGTATTGPSMPLAMRFHCAVKLNTTTVLIIGGMVEWNGSSRKRSTYFYNVDAKSFTPGPLLMEGRSEHACSILDTGAERLVVVTGGRVDGNEESSWNLLDSTEVMDLKQPTIWKTGL